MSGWSQQREAEARALVDALRYAPLTLNETRLLGMVEDALAEIERLQARLAAAERVVEAADYLRAGIVTDPQYQDGDDLVRWRYTQKDAYGRVIEFDLALDAYDNDVARVADGGER